MEFNDAFDPIRALQSSWKLLARAPLPLLVGGGILLITSGGGGGFGGQWNMGGRHGGFDDFDLERMWPLFAGIVAFACCLGIAFFLIASWIQIGFANSVEEVARTGKSDMGTVFESKGRFGAMVLARILCALISIAAMIPFAVIVIGAVILHEHHRLHQNAAILLGVVGCLLWLPVFFYVVLGVGLADQAVALEGCSATDSIRRSWSLVSGHRLMLLLYSIVTGIFALLGICCCCVGVFLTGTMTFIARSESFLALTRGADRPTWWIEAGDAPPVPHEGWGPPPPPPSEGAGTPPTPPGPAV